MATTARAFAPPGGANLVNAESISKTFGTRILLDNVSLGIGAGEVIGVVGRNGDGKSTLLKLLTNTIEPDTGRVTIANSASIGILEQAEAHPGKQTVRDLIVDGAPDHVWASDAYRRELVTQLLGEIDLDAEVARLSGGERRRAALVALMLHPHDLLVLDEPTNHLDVEAVNWLAAHLNRLAGRGTAMLIVSHDRWFLDAVCTRIWEVHDAEVESYDGGYAAYVLARAERSRQASATESRRQNLIRKELAWLRRGAPARTSKPKFRLDAASRLIDDEPPPRDSIALQGFASARLGKDVFDLTRVDYTLPDGRRLIDDLTWSIGPGDRIALIGINGSGKSTLLRLLAGELSPTSGKIKHGQTLRLGHLSQHVGELDNEERVLESVTRLRNRTKLETGRDVSASSLLEDFGFRGDRLITRIGELSGGERRRLQLLRLLMAEPNVLLLDEPTNDLDIDTLNLVEDYLDSWPGTLIVASHDRYFLERVTDVSYALLGDGGAVLLPGGVDEYLERRATPAPAPAPVNRTDSRLTKTSDASRDRTSRKELARVESQLRKLASKIEVLHEQMAAAAADYPALSALQAQLDEALHLQSDSEERWLTLAAELE